MERALRQHFNVRVAKPVSVRKFIGYQAISGFSSHGEWSTLGEIRQLERYDRGNYFPNLKFPAKTPAIWVNLSRRKALRYLEDADQWERLNSDKPLTAKDKRLLQEIVEIRLQPTDIVTHSDGDEGYLILRQ